MQVSADQLARHLQSDLAPLYFISGDEPLLLQEASEAVIRAAAAEGYTERRIFDADNRFDWQTVRSETESLSLFSDKQIIDIRLNGKLSKDGQGFLSEFGTEPALDTVVLVRSEKIEKATQNTKWFKAMTQLGVSVQVWPVEHRQLPRWIDQRCADKGCRVDLDGVRFLAQHVEGNLLAANQEIDKLRLLFPDEPTISLEHVISSVMDSSRYNVFDLVDAALAGDNARVLAVLSGLEQEDTEPTIILWALAREIRTLARLFNHARNGIGKAEAFRKERIFQKRQGLVDGAIRRLTPAGLQALLRSAAEIDRSIKGRGSTDVWAGLLDLTLGLAGTTIIQERV